MPMTSYPMKSKRLTQRVMMRLVSWCLAKAARFISVRHFVAVHSVICTFLSSVRYVLSIQRKPVRLSLAHLRRYQAIVLRRLKAQRRVEQVISSIIASLLRKRKFRIRLSLTQTGSSFSSHGGRIQSMPLTLLSHYPSGQLITLMRQPANMVFN